VLTTLQVSRRRGRTRPSRNDIPLKASRITAQEPVAANILRDHGVAAMILKLTTNDKASIWVNLSRILQMTLIDAQDGYPKTQSRWVTVPSSAYSKHRTNGRKTSHRRAAEIQRCVVARSGISRLRIFASRRGGLCRGAKPNCSTRHGKHVNCTRDHALRVGAT
jgi:hypothetical protein